MRGDLAVSESGVWGVCNKFLDLSCVKVSTVRRQTFTAKGINKPFTGSLVQP
jgi:hypothetical protein